MASITSGEMANCGWLRRNFAGPLFSVIHHGPLLKDTLPKVILPKDNLPYGQFAAGHFVERKISRTDNLAPTLFLVLTLATFIILTDFNIMGETVYCWVLL